ncbi:MAG TPA: ABC transporter substrate-binding protein [Mycobacteriales bacterium]|jgi:peptide/nickel transport system substrate-binding protein|nr:ABC transporter substrate-binding protein [Mycobacteriales bacterium]
MFLNRRRICGLAVAASSAMALAACGGSSTPATGSQGFSNFNQGPQGGTKGGVLKVVGEGDLGNYDPQAVYDTNSFQVARTYARQLYSNPSDNDASKRLAIVPDAAAGQPKVSDDHKSYTITIRKGVKWNTGNGGRQVTAQDFVRGLKMMCNPAAPFGGVGYFTDSIVGFADFCTGLMKVDADAAAIQAYVQDHQVSGLRATDDKTLVITLLQPTSDFMHFLTLTAASARPVEEMQYVPDSPDYRQHLISDGPYQITSYTADRSLTLQRNPVWEASTDSLRAAYVNEIDITMGASQEGIQQQIEAGTADVALGNEPVPTAALPGLIRSGDPQLHLNPTGGNNPYLVFNLLSPNAAVGNVKVRQALNYAVDKSAIVQLLGGPRLAQPYNQIFTPSAVGAGYKAIDPYPTKNDAGDAAKARELLKDAGYPNGVTLKFSYRASGNGPKIAAALQQSVKAAGITLKLKPVPNRDYGDNYLAKTAIAKSGDWDIAEPGWGPDWEGAAERSYFTPLLDGRTYQDGSYNFGDYNNDAVNALADKAFAATSADDATKYWQQAEALMMADAPWVPLVINEQASFVSKRVKNFEYSFIANGPDFTQIAVQ